MHSSSFAFAWNAMYNFDRSFSESTSAIVFPCRMSNIFRLLSLIMGRNDYFPLLTGRIVNTNRSLKFIFLFLLFFFFTIMSYDVERKVLAHFALFVFNSRIIFSPFSYFFQFSLLILPMISLPFF